MLRSDPKGNNRDNKDRKRSKCNYNPRGPSAPSPPQGGSEPPRPPLPLQCVRFKGGAPGPQVLRSPRLVSRCPWFCNLCAAAPAFYLTPRSKSFPPRRDARNANNRTSAPAWAGLGERWGAPGPSRVHPRAGPGGDTKKPGTPTPTADARRDPRGAPPAAKFVAPREPRCPRPGEVSRGPAGSPASGGSCGPPGSPPGSENPLGSRPPIPRPPAPKGRFGVRGEPPAALTDICPAARRGLGLGPP